MKIAAVTDDGKTISQHFGRASKYMVVTVENGEEIGRELRDKLGHRDFQKEGDEEGHSHHEDDERGQDSGTIRRINTGACSRRSLTARSCWRVVWAEGHIWDWKMQGYDLF